ncbi:MAG: hypothetical protein JO345_04085 [Streptosporangiaceae bacterium]|nr:hypothetical protein [Streptosporangiaceae bacterium]
MSYATVDSELLFWFVVVLTLLLVILISALVRTPPGTTGSLRSPPLSPRAPPPPLLVRRPQAAWLAGAGVRSARAGYLPRHAGALKPELMADLGPSYAGAHRQARRHGAHRARVSTSLERRYGGRAGRHRAGVH